MTLRPALLAAAALAAGSCAALALSRWGAGGNSELLEAAREVQRSEELAPHTEGVRRRHEARCVLAAEVLAGKVTLREAAARFRHIDEVDPPYAPGTSLPPRDDWYFCEGVLDYVWIVIVSEERYTAAAR
jgi:hypothetical protein